MAEAAKQPILFVSHFANMSGAPLLLLEIISEFKKRSAVPFRILIVEDGEISKEFEKLGETFIWNKKQNVRPRSFAGRVINQYLKLSLKIHHRQILSRLKDTSHVFFNTITNGHIQKQLLFSKGTFICYVHELEAAIHIATSKEGLEIVLKSTDLFLACSQAVKQNLAVNYGVKAEAIEVVNYSMANVCREKKTYEAFIEAFKVKSNIPAGAVVIGIAASGEWRKGFDMFMPLVSVYFNLYPQSDIYFVWKGFRHETAAAFFDLYDYRKFNNTGRVILLPHGNDSIETIACFDIHLLLSREDPYPLVVLEAASFAIPTVSFAGAGGSPEFIEEDAGFCVPYGDLVKLSQKLHGLAHDKETRNSMGIKARQKLWQRHAPENAMPSFIKILES
jgi:glycosyltransferase involved in cell wall biosynthesis